MSVSIFAFRRRRLPLGGAVLAICLVSLTVARAEEATSYNPTGALTLRDVLSAVLSSSPELAPYSAEIRAREGRTLQAGLLPNPEIGTEVEDFAGSGAQSGFKSAQTTVSLSQLVELGGKRSKRLRVASLDRDLAQWDYEVARLDVFSRATKAFVATVAAQQHLAIADEAVRLSDTAIDALKAQVHVGAVSPVESLRAGVVRGRAESDRLEAQRELADAKINLAATWGATVPTFSTVEADIDDTREPPPLAALVERIASNPDLARWASEIAQREAVIQLEKAAAVPDFTAGLGARHYSETNDGALVFGFSAPLPVFNRNQGAIIEAQQQYVKAKAEQAVVEVAVNTALATNYQNLRTAYDQARLLREKTIPQARSAYEGALDAYRKGLFRYIEALDAQRTLFELREEYLRALVAYHNAAADIERLTGVALDPHSLNEEL